MKYITRLYLNDISNNELLQSHAHPRGKNNLTFGKKQSNDSTGKK